MIKLSDISVIIPTRDRPSELNDLMSTILNQTCLPIEIVVIDDSLTSAASRVVTSFSLKFGSLGCKLKYIKGNGGLTVARNLGTKYSEGGLVLFLDDDTLLDKDVLELLDSFFQSHPDALGVQPKIITKDAVKDGLIYKLGNAVYKVLMTMYHEENKLAVRRSGMSIFPNNITKVIHAQRLSGCCCCYRRRVFTHFSFDTNLKRWGSKEDLDFSYRVYKAYVNALYALPYAKVVHRASDNGRLSQKNQVYMTAIYWFYIFFKDVFQGSLLNLVAFLWATSGNIIADLIYLISKRKPKKEWWSLIYLFKAYLLAFTNLREILIGKLEFFNLTLNN